MPQPQDATTKRDYLPALEELQQGTDLAAAAEPRPFRGSAEPPPQRQLRSDQRQLRSDQIRSAQLNASSDQINASSDQIRSAQLSSTPAQIRSTPAQIRSDQLNAINEGTTTPTTTHTAAAAAGRGSSRRGAGPEGAGGAFTSDHKKRRPQRPPFLHTHLTLFMNKVDIRFTHKDNTKCAKSQ